MQFDLTQDFPAGLDRLWATLGRVEYVELKYRALGSTSVRILKFSADARSIEVELDRQARVALDELPLWARIFCARRQTIRHHTRWQRVGPDRIDVELGILALGGLLSARGSGSVVEPSPGRSRMSLHFEVTSTAAALSSRAARLFAQQIRRALRADHAFTLEHLRAGDRAYDT